MTIYDISKKAGVSIATVSRVLNGSDKVRPATRKKVMDIIEKYDYTPNAFARGMGLALGVFGAWLALLQPGMTCQGGKHDVKYSYYHM